jgi:CO/xanthine dehydrogenase Mo-binding subunit
VTATSLSLRADMLPNFEIALEEVRCKTNPIGVKGIGESGTIGAPPVVINAIIDALGSTTAKPKSAFCRQPPR